VVQERLPCLFCDRTYLNADTVIGHCERDHGAWLATSEAVYGNVCPACGDWFVRLDQHSSMTHHRQIALLFADARGADDPHGVVTTRLRQYARKWLEERNIDPHTIV
jgi:hypothetical protein